MKLFLFGGAVMEEGQFLPQLKFIEKTIRELGAKQLLHIHFARIIASEPEWEGNRFNRHIHVEGLDYLDASNDADIERAQDPIIFISGGSKKFEMMQEINARPKLLKLIHNATYFVGESAGSMAVGKYLRAKKDGEEILIPGLEILKDTIVEVHYTNRKLQQLLENEMSKMNVLYGVGIDCMTAMVFELKDFPRYTTIGDGIVEVKENKDFTSTK